MRTYAEKTRLQVVTWLLNIPPERIALWVQAMDDEVTREQRALSDKARDEELLSFRVRAALRNFLSSRALNVQEAFDVSEGIARFNSIELPKSKWSAEGTSCC